MTAARLTHAQAEFLAAFGEQQDVLVSRARSAVAKAEHELIRPVLLAYGALESYAGRLVEKSGRSLSQDQAIAAALRTPLGKDLYGRYVAATDRVALASERAAEAAADREVRRWATGRLFERVEKAVALGEDMEDAIERELSDPAVARSIGVDPLERVEKGDDAWNAIEKAADRLVAKSGDGLSKAQAIDHVLQEQPHLYTRYLAEVERA
jgi:hypothetical protein